MQSTISAYLPWLNMPFSVGFILKAFSIVEMRVA